MKKIGTKIISYFLLLNFLAISFPIHELFHDHKNAIVEFFTINDSQEHAVDSEHQKKCLHDGHFSEKKEKHICFYTHFNSSFIITDVSIVIFKSFSLKDFSLKNIEKHYLKSFQSYFLRGPPSIYLFT